MERWATSMYGMRALTPKVYASSFAAATAPMSRKSWRRLAGARAWWHSPGSPRKWMGGTVSRMIHLRSCTSMTRNLPSSSALVERYSESLQEDRTVLLRKYSFVDVAHKVVGVGSVGTRCYVALLMGSEEGDPLFLQVKQAQASVLEPHLGPSSYLNHAQRVVRGQYLMQAASDIFLGWTRLESIDFYIRQLRDMKLSVSIESLSESRFVRYCELCGWALARAHARSGDPAQLSGYLGANDTFDQAIASFAEAYADQTERDHDTLVSAVKTGRIPVETGVKSR